MKKLQIFLSALLLVGGIYASDSFEDSFDSFDSFSSESESESNSSGFGSELLSSLEIAGKLNLESRIITPVDKSQSKIDFDLEFSYAKDYSDFYTKLKINEEKEIEVDEAFIKVYYDKLVIDAGRIKNVWGKGDMLHPVDFMNGSDMSDLLYKDYAERSIGEDMLKFTYRGEGESKFIFAWAPNFNANKVQIEDGHPFTPRSIQALYDNNIYTEAQVEALAENDSDMKYNQFAIRHTNTKGRTDYGFTLYKGYIKDMNTVVLYNSNAELYNEKYAFGAEFSRVISGLNTRGEFVYNHTKDTDGNDPLVPNCSIEALIGFDRDLGISSINLNMQLLTTYLFNSDKARDNLDTKGYEADESYDGKVKETRSMLVVTVTDKFKNDTINPESKFVYEIDDDSFMFTNSIEFQLKDDIHLTTGYVWAKGQNESTFGQYEKSDYAFIQYEYNF